MQHLFEPVKFHWCVAFCCRGLHTVTAADNKLYLFGGASQKGQMLNDLWVLDLGTMQWTQLQPQGKAPHIRCSHTAVLVGQDIIFCGGSYYRYCGVMTCPARFKMSDMLLPYCHMLQLWNKLILWTNMQLGTPCLRQGRDNRTVVA